LILQLPITSTGGFQPSKITLYIQIGAFGLTDYISIGVHDYIEGDGIGLEVFDLEVDVLLTDGLFQLVIHLGGVPLYFGEFGAVVGVEGHNQKLVAKHGQHLNQYNKDTLMKIETDLEVLRNELNEEYRERLIIYGYYASTPTDLLRPIFTPPKDDFRSVYPHHLGECPGHIGYDPGTLYGALLPGSKEVIGFL